MSNREQSSREPRAESEENELRLLWTLPSGASIAASYADVDTGPFLLGFRVTDLEGRFCVLAIEDFVRISEINRQLIEAGVEDYLLDHPEVQALPNREIADRVAAHYRKKRRAQA